MTLTRMTKDNHIINVASDAVAEHELLGWSLVDDDQTVVIKRKTIILTDEEIKALPTTPLALLADDPAKLILPLFVVFQADTNGGAYTNIDPDFANLNVWYTGGFDTPLWSVDNNSTATPVKDNLTSLLTAGALSFAVLTPNQPGYTTSGDAINLTNYLLSDGIQGLGLEVAINNNLAGNLEDGDAANTLQVTVCYLEIGI